MPPAIGLKTHRCSMDVRFVTYLVTESVGTIKPHGRVHQSVKVQRCRFDSHIDFMAGRPSVLMLR
jgi:hypothetical protein